MLQDFATLGCPSDIKHPWTFNDLQAAILRGAHPSARTPEASKALRAEVLEKVKQGYAKLVSWEEIKQHIPKMLKISPIAAIPHKSRLFRMILDLSFVLNSANCPNADQPKSVNDSTDRKAAPLHAMSQLGQVLPHIINALATQPTEAGPILMA